MKYVKPSRVSGRVKAPASKSLAQRAVLAASLADGVTEVIRPSFCADVLAAVGIARALGARVEPSGDSLRITGSGEANEVTLDCDESGLCMRAACALASLWDREFIITGRGSLMARPAGMVEAPLRALGAVCETKNGFPPIRVSGPLQGGRVRVEGSTTSQFLTGLLMALPLCKEDSEILVSGLVSAPYVQMTMGLLEAFGIRVSCERPQERFLIPGRQAYKPAIYEVEGDWSGAAFLLVAGALAGRVEVEGLRTDSRQADKAVLEALRAAGASVQETGASVVVAKGDLRAFEFNATDCPDLAPPLAALACHCAGRSVIAGAQRLMHKESDRSSALLIELSNMGGRIRVSGDKIEIMGGTLQGGAIDSHGDHRIAMACAIAALSSQAGAAVTGWESVSKSYPNFFWDLESLTRAA